MHALPTPERPEPQGDDPSATQPTNALDIRDFDTLVMAPLDIWSGREETLRGWIGEHERQALQLRRAAYDTQLEVDSMRSDAARWTDAWAEMREWDWRGMLAHYPAEYVRKQHTRFQWLTESLPALNGQIAQYEAKIIDLREEARRHDESVALLRRVLERATSGR